MKRNTKVTSYQEPKFASCCLSCLYVPEDIGVVDLEPGVLRLFLILDVGP